MLVELQIKQIKFKNELQNIVKLPITLMFFFYLRMTNKNLL